ncbi:MAG: hypothetical protein ABIL01_04105 [Pseudomonadota bacterium]
MTDRPVISRRSLLAGLWLAGTSFAWAQVRRGDDHGIGGTGITRGNDQGIGGTGIVGVIQRFGSIFINGERIGMRLMWRCGSMTRRLRQRHCGSAMSRALSPSARPTAP